MFTSFPNVVDKFSNDRCPSEVKFLNDRHTLTLNKCRDTYTTIYGELSIDHGRFEWAIKINKCGDKQGIIGVATGSALKYNRDKSGKFSDELTGYGFSLNGLLRSGGQIINYPSNNILTSSLHEGDILFIRLDLNNQTLSFAKNGILLDININNIPLSSYRLAISIYDNNESYSIVSASKYLSLFSLYQHKLSILPLQDRFKYTGHMMNNTNQKKKYLKFAVHNTVVEHTNIIINANNKIKNKIFIDNNNNNNNNNNNYNDVVDTAYGSRWISRNIFEWIIQIQGVNAQFIHIGIYGHYNTNNVIFKSNFDHNKYGYGITHNGYKLNNQLQSGSDDDNKEMYCSGFSLLDLIHIRLNLINKTLSFIRNGNYLGCSFQNIFCTKNFGYRLAIKLKKSNCRVSIVAAYPVTNNQKLTLETILLNTKNNSVSSRSSSSSLSSQDANNNTDKKESKFKFNVDNDNVAPKDILSYLNQIQNNMNIAKKTIDIICNKFDKLNGNIILKPKTLVNNNNNNDNNNNNNNSLISLPQLLLAKECGTKFNNCSTSLRESLTKWMNKITPSIITHFKNWESWNSDEITDWIISLKNGIFLKYETQLRNEMKKAELKGTHLITISQKNISLQRFGIVKFDEELLLKEYLNKLIDGSYTNNIMKQLMLNNNNNNKIKIKKKQILQTTMVPLISSKSYSGPTLFTHSTSINKRVNRNFLSNPHKNNTQDDQLINTQYMQYRSFPIKKSPRITNNNTNNNNNSKESMTAQQKIQQLKHQYHQQQLGKIAKQQKELEQKQKELQKQKLLQQQHAKELQKINTFSQLTSQTNGT